MNLERIKTKYHKVSCSHNVSLGVLPYPSLNPASYWELFLYHSRRGAGGGGGMEGFPIKKTFRRSMHPDLMDSTKTQNLATFSHSTTNIYIENQSFMILFNPRMKQ